MGFSIIIPVKGINHYIEESIPITLGLDHPDFEILILPNDLPEGELPAYLRDPRVKLIASGRVSPAVKRDLGAKHAKYEYLAFLDDDAFPARDWLKVADKIFRETKVAALGGPGITPERAPWFEQVSGLFFESLVGGGGMDYRYKPAGKGFYVDDYPTVNLIVDKKAFFDVGGFDNNFWPGEDTKFCLDLVTKGYKIWYDPTLVVWHHRRPTLKGHLKQVGNYGKHRGYFAKKFPATSARVTYFVPAAFLVANVLLLILGLIARPEFFALLGLMLALYFVLGTVDLARRGPSPRLLAATLGTMYCSHIYYGWMFLRGLCSRHGFKSQLR